MCGVYGHIGKNSGRNVEACLARIAHRGPDHQGVYRHGSVALGHRRLSIIDVSEKGNQPMTSASGCSTIVFNGEIYNYRELKQNLEGEGATFATGSDTEVILEGYERHGTEFLEQIRGMWAFVLYDTKNNEIVASRDPFGIKPLYYAVRGAEIYFASDIRCLREAGIALEPNAAQYYMFYNLGYFLAPLTSWKDVFKLLPGEVVSWSVEKSALQRVRRISRFAARPALAVDSYEKGVDALDQAFTDSVKAHYVSDVPVSLLLSGGNDSSLIAALSKKLGMSPTAYHIAVRGSEDTYYAQKVAGELGMPLVVEELSEQVLAAQYAKVWDVLDEPTGDTSIIPTSLVFERIKGQAKVVLSGDGGDELFGGYGRHRTLAHHKAVRRTHALTGIVNSLASAHSLSFVATLGRQAGTVLFGRGLVDDLIGAYLKGTRIIGYPIEETKVRNSLFELYMSEKDSRILPSLMFDMTAYLPDDLLYKTDIASMASSIEARVPLIDRYLYSDAAAVLRTVDGRKATDNKRILKDVLARYVSSDIVERPKKGFGVPMMSYDTTAFVADFHAACAFHLAHRGAFGVSLAMASLIEGASSRNSIVRKYPRFAFALISNWKTHA